MDLNGLQTGCMRVKSEGLQGFNFLGNDVFKRVSLYIMFLSFL